MIKRHSYGNVTWVDVEHPSDDEISSLVKEYKLHPLLGEELSRKSYKPKIEVYKNCIYTVLHFPARILSGGKYTIIEKEVDFVVGENFIITTKYSTVEPLHTFSKAFEINSILDKNGKLNDSGMIWYYMLIKMYKNLEIELEGIKDEMRSIESQIFEGHEKKMVSKISHVARELLDITQMIRSHGEIMNDLKEIDLSRFFGNEFKYFALDIYNKYQKIMEISANHKELVADLRETNDSLLSTKQNETMKMLTLMAFVTFPLSLITDIFSMNTAHAPIIGSFYDFEIILAIMTVATLIMFLFFKFKKWL